MRDGVASLVASHLRWTTCLDASDHALLQQFIVQTKLRQEMVRKECVRKKQQVFVLRLCFEKC